MSILDDARFWSQVMTDLERTIVCPPELESRLKVMIDARGLSGLLAVLPSPVCPDDTVIVLDQHAMDASMAQVMTSRGAFRGR